MLTFRGGLTEDQIEGHVEVITDHVDARYMSGKIDTAEYELTLNAISEWSDKEYRFRRR